MVDVHKGWHPLLAPQGGAVSTLVPNDCALGGECLRVLLLSGPHTPTHSLQARPAGSCC